MTFAERTETEIANAVAEISIQTEKSLQEVLEEAHRYLHVCLAKEMND